ncbi:cell division protein FtsX [Hypnocyclicus thermotrophus]|uniref:Cell division protein FtsX n=1 Tax=Hypnocyclicus thermotrophus TaxID=1627895 RepID=A0AA46DZF8_9FUSO|nr:permease-like cell division protein FtsX [Hypnocyclicus thermotrophus]TDT71733.1 cell division protein FtsX [Hypnocyclicus thermotrophus]
MRKELLYIYNQTLELTTKKDKILRNNIFILAIIFLLINFFLGFFLNLYKIEGYISDNIQIKINFSKNLDLKNIKDFEKKILENKNIDYVKFLPQDMAFKNLEDELGMKLGTTNPLNNSMILYLKNVNNLEELGRVEYELTKYSEIEEVIIKREFLDKLLKLKNNILKILKLGAIILIIPLIILFYFIFNLNFSYLEKEILLKHETHEVSHNILILIPYFFKKLIGLIISWIIAYIVFIPFYDEIILTINGIDPFIVLASFNEIQGYIFLSFVIVVILLILATIIGRVKKYEE